MSKSNVSFIRSVATKCLGNKYDPPIEVESILTEKYSFEIYRIDLKDKTCAVVDLDNRSIGLNKLHHIHRQRFTLAHELGHFLLQHDQRKFDDLIIDLNSTNHFEVEANIFAGELLVPLQVAKQYKNKFNPVRLSEIFLVSSEVIYISFLRYKLI